MIAAVGTKAPMAVVERRGGEAILEGVARATPALNASMAAAWFGNFLATALDPGDAPTWFARAGDGAAQGLAMRWRRRGFGPLSVRQVASLTNVYSCVYGLAGASDDSAAVLHRWAGELGRRPDAPDCVQFGAIDHPSGLFDDLSQGLGAAGFWVETARQFSNWYWAVAAAGDFAAYWNERPSRLRHTVERKHRALRRGHAVAVDILCQPQQAEKASRVYAEVDGQSWKGAEPYPRFMPGLIESGLANGSVRVGVLSVDGEAAAVQVWLEHAGHATIFKLSYAERFKQMSVGSVLTYCLIREVFERGGVREIDFGRGDDDYKRDWLPLERERWGIFAYNRSTSPGWLLAARNLLPKLARRRLQNAP